MVTPPLVAPRAAVAVNRRDELSSSSPPPPSGKPQPHKASTGFTLTELLVVVAIIVALMALLTPAFTGLKGGSDLTKAAYDIQGFLDNARAYAMANNTYVYVGIVEVDSSLEASNPRQVNKDNPDVGGRIAIAAVASKNGTRGYENTGGDLPNPAWDNNNAGYNNGANLVAIGNLQRFENVHLAPYFATLANSGGLSRPSVKQGEYQLGNATDKPNPGDCVTPFDWPLGSAIDKGQYSFKRVINFDPQGAARIQYTGNQDFISRYMEIGLIPARGTAVSSTLSNVAAIQIQGITGSSHIYRP